MITSEVSTTSYTCHILTHCPNNKVNPAPAPAILTPCHHWPPYIPVEIGQWGSTPTSTQHLPPLLWAPAHMGECGCWQQFWPDSEGQQQTMTKGVGTMNNDGWEGWTMNDDRCGRMMNDDGWGCSLLTATACEGLSFFLFSFLCVFLFIEKYILCILCSWDQLRTGLGSVLCRTNPN